MAERGKLQRLAQTWRSLAAPWRFVAVCLAIACPSASALAASPAVWGGNDDFVEVGPHLQLLEDPGGRLVVDDVRKPGYAHQFVDAGPNGFTRGYTKSAWWARLTIDRQDGEQRPLQLRVGFLGRDEVQVFVDFGDRAVPVAGERGGPGLPTMYHLSAPHGAPTTVWLRAESRTAPIVLPMELWHSAQLQRELTMQGHMGGVVMGLCGALLLAVALIGLFTRRAASMWMMVHMVGVVGAVQALAGTPFSTMLAAGNWWDHHDFMVWQATAVAGALLFSRGFLPGGPYCRCSPVLATVAGVVAAATVAAVASDEPQVESLAQCAFAVAMVLLWAVTAAHAAQGNRESRWLLAAWTFAGAAVLLGTASRMGWIAADLAVPSDRGYLQSFDILLLVGGYADQQAQTRLRLAQAELQAERAAEILRTERQDRVRSVMSETPNPVLLADFQGNICFANRALSALLGYEPGELEGQPVEVVVPLERRASHRQLQRQYLEGGGTPRPMVGRGDLAARRKDGTAVPVRVDLVPYVVGDEHYVLAAVRDLTDERGAQRALVASEERFRSLADNLPGAVVRFAVGPNPRPEYASRGIAELLGLPADWSGESSLQPIDFVHPDDWDAYRCAVAALEATGEPMNLEHRIVRPDGSIRWVQNSAVLTRDSDGKPQYRDGRLIDITDRRLAAQQIDEQRALLQAVVDSLDGALAVTDTAGRFLTVNRRWEAYRGADRRHVVGRTVSDLRNAGLLADQGERATQVAHQGDVRVVELEVERAGLSQIRLSTVSPLRDAQGRLHGTCAYTVDVTAERQLRRDLATARDQAMSASRAKSAFMANMSHEIRTPMNAVLGFADVLAAQVTDRDLRGHAQLIGSSGRALLALIDDVLDLAKVESGKMELHVTPVHLPTLAADLCRLLAVRCSAKGIALDCSVDPRLDQSLLLDEVRVRQVLTNLLGNAIKFTESGRVELAIAAQGDAVARQQRPVPSESDRNHGQVLGLEPRSQPDSRQLQNGALEPHRRESGGDRMTVHIQVRDTGPGIPADQQLRIFEAFEQRTGQDHSQYGGSGLGLSITRRLVELMNGTIHVDSQLGMGSTFHIVIPDVQCTHERAVSRAESARGEPVFTGQRVLIVDDDAANRLLLRAFLQDSGLQLAEAASAEAALQAVTAQRPDLLVTDLKMPGMGGEALVAALQADPTLADLPVVVVTASGLAGDHARTRSRVAGFLVKPVTRQTVLLELAKHLQPGTWLAASRASTPRSTHSVLRSGEVKVGPDVTEWAELRSQWELLNGSGDLDGLAALAQQVMRHARLAGSDDLRRWAQRLDRAVADCALGDIDRTMREFADLHDQTSTRLAAVSTVSQGEA